MVGEVCRQHIRIRHQDLHHGLGKPLHIPVPDLGVLALQLLEHLKALGQLGEHIHYRTGEVGVFCVLSELEGGEQSDIT